MRKIYHTIPGARVTAGGDFGKKELSPALANRFTTVWVPAIQDEAELAAILRSRLPGAVRSYKTSGICRHAVVDLT
jgi:hypothetical protein